MKKLKIKHYKESWEIKLHANSHEDAAELLAKIVDCGLFYKAINDIEITEKLGTFVSKRIR